VQCFLDIYHSLENHIYGKRIQSHHFYGKSPANLYPPFPDDIPGEPTAMQFRGIIRKQDVRFFEAELKHKQSDVWII
jgi:hypothetical protein